MDEDQRRRAAVAAITARYLKFVDEHKTDAGFSTGGMGTVQEIRQAVLSANYVRRAGAGLELTGEGQSTLRSAGL